MTLRNILVTSLLLVTPAVPVAQSVTVSEGQQATVYKLPTCACCEGYIAFLRQQGVRVEAVTDDAALALVKAEQRVPYDVQSCHTVLLGGYVLEGHVPLVALEKLLAEQPEVTGIAVPGMPTGTPGIEGPRIGNLDVITFGEGGVGAFLSL